MMQIRGRFAACVLSLWVLFALPCRIGHANPYLDLECDTSSVATWQVHFQEPGTGSTAAAAVLDAMYNLEIVMIEHSDVWCGPCEDLDQCQASPSGLSSSYVIDVKETSPGVWTATATYIGTYHITCGACDV